MSAIITLVIQIAEVYLLFKIMRSIATVAGQEQRKRELTDAIERFGEMFADVAEKKRVKKAVETPKSEIA